MDCAEVSMGKADGRAAKNTRGEKEHWGNGDVKAHGYRLAQLAGLPRNLI